MSPLSHLSPARRAGVESRRAAIASQHAEVTALTDVALSVAVLKSIFALPDSMRFLPGTPVCDATCLHIALPQLAARVMSYAIERARCADEGAQMYYDRHFAAWDALAPAAFDARLAETLAQTTVARAPETGRLFAVLVPELRRRALAQAT